MMLFIANVRLRKLVLKAFLRSGKSLVELFDIIEEKVHVCEQMAKQEKRVGILGRTKNKEHTEFDDVKSEDTESKSKGSWFTPKKPRIVCTRCGYKHQTKKCYAKMHVQGYSLTDIPPVQRKANGSM